MILAEHVLIFTIESPVLSPLNSSPIFLFMYSLIKNIYTVSKLWQCPLLLSSHINTDHSLEYPLLRASVFSRKGGKKDILLTFLLMTFGIEHTAEGGSRRPFKVQPYLQAQNW